MLVKSTLNKEYSPSRGTQLTARHSCSNTATFTVSCTVYGSSILDLMVENQQVKPQPKWIICYTCKCRADHQNQTRKWCTTVQTIDTTVPLCSSIPQEILFHFFQFFLKGFSKLHWQNQSFLDWSLPPLQDWLSHSQHAEATVNVPAQTHPSSGSTCKPVVIYQSENPWILVGMMLETQPSQADKSSKNHENDSHFAQETY